jgi:membrane protein YdbS with pleckstrin-like domain
MTNVSPPAPSSPAPAPSRLLRPGTLTAQEQVLLETRATGLFYFPGPIVFLIVIGALLVFASTSGALSGIRIAGTSLATYVVDLLLILLIVGFLWLFVRYLRWISTVYAVTSRRVILQRGIFSRNFDEIPILQVRGVDVHQGVLQRLLGYGSVRVSSEGGRTIGNELWGGIPRPFRLQKIIENAMLQQQNRPQPVVVVNAPGAPVS